MTVINFYLTLLSGSQWKQQILFPLEEMGKEFFFTGYWQEIMLYRHQ